MQELIAHPQGESTSKALIPVSGPVAVETMTGRVYVDWNPDAALSQIFQESKSRTSAGQSYPANAINCR